MTIRCKPRRTLTLLLFGAPALVLLTAACTGIASPEGWSAPVLDPSAEGILLVSLEDELFALDPATLQVQWRFPSGEEREDIDVVALYGEPAVIGDAVFIPGYDDNLYAVDIESGVILPGWPFETDGALVGGVLVDEDTVYVGSSDNNVYALDSDGNVRWSFEADDSVWSTPALASGTLYVTSLDGNLYALEAESGRLLWSFETDAGIASPPVVDEAAGLVYVGGLDSELRAVEIETHRERWEVKADNWFWTRPLVANGVVYAGNLDGNVYAVDAATGELRWPKPFEAEAEIRAAPALIGDVLFIVDRDGQVYGIDAERGTAAFDAPLALEEDVLADPLVRTVAPNGGDAQGPELIVVTTDETLVRIDPVALDVIDRQKLAGE